MPEYIMELFRPIQGTPVMFVLGLLLIVLGIKGMLTPIPSFGLKTVINALAESYGMSPAAVLDHDNEEAAMLAIYFLRTNSIASIRGLAREFGYRPGEIEQLLRKAQWQIQADRTLQAHLDRVDRDFQKLRNKRGNRFLFRRK